MCYNRKFSEEEQKRIDKMGSCAVEILKGATGEEAAKTNSVTVEEFEELIAGLPKYNPLVYHQVMEKLGRE